MPSCLYDRIAVTFLYNTSKIIFGGVLLYNTQVGLYAHLRIDFLKKHGKLFLELAFFHYIFTPAIADGRVAIHI